MQITDIEKHISWGYSTDVKEICRPLFDATGLNYFDYARFYKDKRAVLLYTGPEWVKTFLNEFSYKTPPTLLGPGVHLWSSYLTSEQYNCAIEHFEHEHGITLISSFEDYDEVVNFAGPSSNRYLISFYLNNLDFLRKYRDQFVEMAGTLIKKVTQQSVVIIPEMIHFDVFGTHVQYDYIQQIYKLRGADKYNLTKRELDCAGLLTEGLSAKLIARELEISPKTVEKHIENMKEKLNCRTSLEIVTKVIKEKILTNT